MKRIALISFISMSIVFAMVLVLAPRNVIGSKQAELTGPGIELPHHVLVIVQKACMDCHSDDGNYFAKMKLNFQKWNSYNDSKQAKKANAMCKKLSKEKMPPKRWRAGNPDKIPTQAEVDMVCRWAQGLQK